MQKLKSFLTVLLLLTALSTPALAQGAPAVKLADPTPASKKMCEALSEITGVAISPLLGMGAVGAVKYYRTPEDQRDKLPWFCIAAFWVPAILIVVLCMA